MYNSTLTTSQQVANTAQPENQLQCMQQALQAHQQKNDDANMYQQALQIIDNLEIELPNGCLQRLQNALATHTNLV